MTGNERFNLVYDSAYWLSDITVTDPDSDDGGVVDAISYADGYAPPATENYEGTGTEPSSHTKRGTRWHEPVQKSTPWNAFSLDLTDINEVTIWVEEAGLDVTDEILLSVSTNTATTVHLAIADGATPVEVPAGDHEVAVDVCT